MPQHLTPMDVAEKWIAAASHLWTATGQDSTVVATLRLRVAAHYGTATPHVSLLDICTVAAVEAMNEWQHHQEAARDQEADDDMFKATTLSGVPYDEIEMP